MSITPIVRKLATYAAYLGQAAISALNSSPGAALSTWILKISRVIATAKTPSLNASTRPLLTGARLRPHPDPSPEGEGNRGLAGSSQDAEPAKFHPGDGDAQRDEQQLNRDRGRQGSARLNRWKLLAHQQGDRKRQAGSGEPGQGRDQGDGRFVAMLATQGARETAAAHFNRTKQQHDPESDLCVFRERGKERDIRQHQSVDQRCHDPITRSGAPVDEEREVSDEIWIGQLVQARQKELNAERRLDQRRGCERGVAAGRQSVNSTGRRRTLDRRAHGFHILVNVLSLPFMPLSEELRTL